VPFSDALLDARLPAAVVQCRMRRMSEPDEGQWTWWRCVLLRSQQRQAVNAEADRLAALVGEGDAAHLAAVCAPVDDLGQRHLRRS